MNRPRFIAIPPVVRLCQRYPPRRWAKTLTVAAEVHSRRGRPPNIGLVKMRPAMLRLLASIVSSWSDSQLERRFGSRVGQRAVFEGMARSFVPEAAAGFAGELEYELSRPVTGAAPVRWTVEIAAGRATARPGAATRPK